MTAQPHWSPVDDDTASLLSLVANDQMTDHADREWAEFVSELRQCADASGRIDPNHFRRMVRDVIAPKREGAFTVRAKAEGLIADTGEWVISDDHQGRNAGRPCRVYRLT